MPEVPERIARLVGRLDEVRGEGDCPVCAANAWDYGLDVLAIPKGAPNPKRQGLDVLTYICSNCGYLRLHSAPHLEGRPQDWSDLPQSD